MKRERIAAAIRAECLRPLPGLVRMTGIMRFRWKNGLEKNLSRTEEGKETAFPDKRQISGGLFPFKAVP